jgi:hypothetical protein
MGFQSLTELHSQAEIWPASRISFAESETNPDFPGSFFFGNPGAIADVKGLEPERSVLCRVKKSC